MPQAPHSPGDGFPPTAGEPSPAEKEAADSLAVLDGRCETVLQLIGDEEVANSVRTACGDLQRALLRYARERLARAVPAAVHEVHRAFEAIEAERCGSKHPGPARS